MIALQSATWLDVPINLQLPQQEVPAALWTSFEGSTGPPVAIRRPLYMIHR